MERRKGWNVVAACAAFLVACGGSSDPQTVCTHAAVPATGPGDVSQYFPVEVGRTWTYQTCCDGPGTHVVTVGAPTTLQGEQVSQLEYTWTINPYSGGVESGSGVDRYAVRPAGVYLVSSTDASSPVEKALPLLVLPFPVQLPEETLQVTCTHVRVSEGGTVVDADLSVSFMSVSTGLDMTVSGSLEFTDVAYVFRNVELTMRVGGATVPATIGILDWYAPGVGLIKEEVTMITAGYMGTDAIELSSYAPPPTAGAPAGPAALAAADDRSGPPEDAPGALALRVARRLGLIRR